MFHVKHAFAARSAEVDDVSRETFDKSNPPRCLAIRVP